MSTTTHSREKEGESEKFIEKNWSSGLAPAAVLETHEHRGTSLSESNLPSVRLGMPERWRRRGDESEKGHLIKIK